MPDRTGLLSQWYVTIDGQEMSETFRHAMFSGTVESSLHLPDVATIMLHDPGGEWADAASLAPGKSLVINARAGNTQHKLFDGEIVELESDFVIGDRRVVVRAFDRLHRLARIRGARTFLNASDSDIVNKCAREAGLTAQCGDASIVHDYVLQDGTSNLEFLQERAALLGYMLWVDGSKLHFDKHGAQSASLSLEFGATLSEFHPRLTTVDQVNSVSVNGWDPKQAQAVTGKADSANGTPKISQTTGGALAQQAFQLEANVLVLDRPVRDQDVAQKIAQGVLDRRAGRCVEAEGLTHGEPTLIAGVEVEIKSVGSRFNGKYFVTGATHTYGGPQGYVTRFTVSGYRPATLLSLIGDSDHPPATSQRVGLVIGLVTDLNDPEHLGRVKVKFPWMSDQVSDWARVAMPGAGPKTGIEFMPEVNDEVLIGFEHGNVNAPFVLGGMWNGKTNPPVDFTTAIKNGKVQQRIIKSRTGHTVTLNDSEDAPSIEILDNTGKNKIHLDSKNNKLTVHLEGDMLFEANGEIAIKAQKVTVEASDALKMKGNTLDAEAQTSVNIKASTDLKLKGLNSELGADANLKLNGGAQSELKAGAHLLLDGGGVAEVKGAIVKVGS